jgi:hypothetical protein
VAVDLGLVLPLVAFVILVALFVVVLRRASVVFADTRRAVSFRQAIGEIEERIDGDLAAIVELTDPLRKAGSGLPDEEIVSDVLARAQASVTWARERARDLIPPNGLDDARLIYMDQLSRADESLRSLEHGIAILGPAPADPRAQEGRTAVKRGYIGLVHVLEDLAAESRRVAAWRSAGEQGLIARQRS